MIMRAGNSNICRVGRTGDTQRANAQFSSEGHFPAEFPLAGGKSVFGLLRPSTGWMGPTHIMKDNLLYLKSTDCQSYKKNIVTSGIMSDLETVAQPSRQHLLLKARVIILVASGHFLSPQSLLLPGPLLYLGRACWSAWDEWARS